MPRPLVYPVVALMGGITTGYFLPAPDLPLLAVLLALFAGLFAALMRKKYVLILPLTATAIYITGILNINLYLSDLPGPRHIVRQVSQEKLTVEGIVDEAPEESPEGKRIIVAARSILKERQIVPVEGRVMLQTGSAADLQYGDLIRFRCRLRKPHNFNNPGSFDYEKHLRVQGIMVQGSVSAASDILLIRRGLGNSLKRRLEEARNRLREVIIDNTSSPAREIIRALLLGETKPIPSLLRENFNRTGTSHILAISGFNVAMVASCVIFLALLALKSSPYLLLRFDALRVATSAALIPVLIYTSIAGLGISVIRAAIMLIVFLAAVILRKERDLFNTLALAAMIILIVSPYALFDVSFQLSFAAVASLVSVSPLFTAFLRSKEGDHSAAIPTNRTDVPTASFSAENTRKTISSLVRKAANTLLLFIALSLTATLGTLPFILYYFNGFSTIMLPANAVAIPLLGMLALGLGLAAIIALLFSTPLAALLIKLAAFPADLSVMAINFLASLPGSYLRVSTPTLAEIICYYLLMTLLVLLIHRKIGKKTPPGDPPVRTPAFFKFALAATTLFFAADALYLAVSGKLRRNLQVTALDVGQGSATFIRLPGGANMLIDGGGSSAGSFDIGKFVLAPYLWRERIGRIDLVVLTHGHPDHLKGLLPVLQNFSIGEVWTNGRKANTEDYDNFLKLIAEKGIRHRISEASTAKMTIKDVNVTIFNSPPAETRSRNKAELFREENDGSLVIRIGLGKINFLLPGDISSYREQEIIAAGTDLQSDILFVPHHGSFHSSSELFLRAVRPRIAVISCGRDNVFHLPHPAVIRRYADLPAQVYRTDLHGAVTMTTDGEIVTVRTAGGK